MAAEDERPPPPPGRHEWFLMGGGGGWEIWRCRRCGLDRIPVPLFGLWRPIDALRRGCRG